MNESAAPQGGQRESELQRSKLIIHQDVKSLEKDRHGRSLLQKAANTGREKNKQKPTKTTLNKHNSPSAHKHTPKSEVMERLGWINTAVAICPPLTVLAATKSSCQTTEQLGDGMDSRSLMGREKTGFNFKTVLTEKTLRMATDLLVNLS